MTTWKVIDYGEVSPGAAQIEFDCPGCKSTALLPVKGVAIAQLREGVVFDGQGAMPAAVQCRKCGRIFEKDK